MSHLPSNPAESFKRVNPHIYGEMPEVSPVITSLSTAFAPAASTDVAKLNKTERAYHEYLKLKRYDWLGVQCVTLKLADDTRLTPDFAYITNGMFYLVDVKGFQREDALIKMKVAARMFPWAQFLIVKKTKTGWDEKRVKP
jgi:hypothetical protein